MVEFLIKWGLKFVSYDTLVRTIAQALAYIIAYARANAGVGGWEKAKRAIKEIKNWLTLFDEVYEDDTLTPDEEKKIQDAIANCTLTTSIYDMLQGKKAPKKVVLENKYAKKVAPTKKPAKKIEPKKISKRNAK